MENVTVLHRELKGEWDLKTPNLRKCGKLLDDLKVNRGHSVIIDNKHLNLNLSYSGCAD